MRPKTTSAAANLISSEVANRLFSATEPIPESGCLLWMGALQSKGYGMLRFNGGNEYAHRLAWMIHNGPIPQGMQVLHHCDIRCCIRHQHLFLGTPADNMRDMYRKGRNAQPCGELAGRAKLTVADVMLIRASQERTSVLARRFGMSHQGIAAIRQRLTWRHVA